MQHSSGIADYREQKDFNVSSDYKPEQLVQLVETASLSFEPGTETKAGNVQ